MVLDVLSPGYICCLISDLWQIGRTEDLKPFGNFPRPKAWLIRDAISSPSSIPKTTSLPGFFRPLSRDLFMWSFSNNSGHHKTIYMVSSMATIVVASPKRASEEHLLRMRWTLGCSSTWSGPRWIIISFDLNGLIIGSCWIEKIPINVWLSMP